MNTDYLYTFFQTNILEVIIFYLFYSIVFFKKNSIHNFGKTALLTHFGNCVTHPIVFFGFMGIKMTYLKSVLIAEVFAFLTEGLLHFYFGKIPFKKAMSASLLANFFSWQIEPIISYFLFF
jgi:hypothetical protein